MSSSSSDNAPASDRREFLHRVVGAGVAVAGSSLLAGCATTGAAAGVSNSRPAQNAGQWDMSWRNKLARFRTAYDSPEVYDGAALAYADAAYAGYTETGVKEADFTPILILRHRATSMVLDDEMWSRMGLGETFKLKDPTTGETAKRNPFINWKQGDRHSNIGRRSGIDSLVSRGAVVLACNKAMAGLAYTLREKEKDRWTSESALAELHKHVLPGCYVMPNGVFAVSAAQDSGANYMRVLV
jgi:hypothetical protein